MQERENERRQVDAEPQPKDRGFALIVVLWLGVLLALMAAGFSSAVRSRLRTTSADAELVQAQAFADAGARIALLDLLNQKPGEAPHINTNGAPLTCSIDGRAALIIRVEDEEGKVSLNGASEEVLSALFAGLGTASSEARGYAQAIIDFRDPDDDKLPDGAERSDYPTNTAGPKNAPFASVDELDQVVGLPEDVRERAKPHLSALSGEAGIDETVAAGELKELLVRGSGGIWVAADLSAGKPEPSISSQLPAGFRIVSSRKLYRISAEAVLASGSRYASDVIVRLPDGAAYEPSYQRWRRGASIWPHGRPVPAPSQLKPC